VFNLEIHGLNASPLVGRGHWDWDGIRGGLNNASDAILTSTFLAEGAEGRKLSDSLDALAPRKGYLPSQTLGMISSAPIFAALYQPTSSIHQVNDIMHHSGQQKANF